MISVSIISPSAREYITQALSALEKKEAITILMAVESGSRAWGFPSIDSDYDVRFIYIRKECEYLSVINHRDVIETDIIDNPHLGVPFDLSGWDIRKSLLLAIKSNAVILEWLHSPIVYIQHENSVRDLLAFADKTATISSLKSHYFRLMIHAWEQITATDGPVKAKLYCYALRPALALHWFNQHNSLAPMDIFSLARGVTMPAQLESEISNLIALKMTVEEHELIARNSILDNFIATLVQESHEKVSLTIDPTTVAEADTFFQRLLVEIKK